MLLLLSVTMITVNVLLMTSTTASEHEAACKAVSVLIHFGLLMMFSLMTVASFHLYIKVVGVFKKKNSTAMLALIPLSKYFLNAINLFS